MPAPRRVFHNPDPLTPATAHAALRGPDPTAAANAIVALALHEDDWRWVQAECEWLATHPEANLRRLSAVCLGHLARLHGVIDRERAEAQLRSLAVDPDRWVRGAVEDALGDFKVFLRWRPAIVVRFDGLPPPAI